jgi:hypothetical protein
MVDEGLITAQEAVMRIQPDQLDFFLHPQFTPKSKADAAENGTRIATGLNVSPGAAVGVIAFDADLAEKWTKEDKKQVIMVRPETKPDDVHGMLAALSNPLMAAIIRGNSDIFNGFLGAYDPVFLNQLVGDADAYFVQLQDAGLIRADIPASIITYLLTALKVGIINSSDIISQEHMPSMEQLTEVLSDLIRRWLEPEQLPSESDVGKQLWTEYLDNVKEPE